MASEKDTKQALPPPKSEDAATAPQAVGARQHRAGLAPQTLDELIATLRGLSEKGELTSEIVAWLQGYVRKLGIGMHKELVSLKTGATVHSSAADPFALVLDKIMSAASTPRAHDGKESGASAAVASPAASAAVVSPAVAAVASPTEDAPDLVVSKIILINPRTNIAGRPPLCSECNGVVLDPAGWRAISRPPPVINEWPAWRTVRKHLEAGLYSVYEVKDGTMLTLYSWCNPGTGVSRWCLSSANGYDVSRLRWIGSKTYAEVVLEAWSKYPEFMKITNARIVDSPNGKAIELDNIDRKGSYTFGFRHHDFHPLKDDPPSVWQDAAAGGAGGTHVLPGIPVVAPVSAAVSYTEMVKRCGGALAAATSAAVAEPRRFFYGYLLRSKDTKATGSDSEVLMPSTLLERVRSLVYEPPSAEDAPSVDHTNMLSYNLMRGLLGLGGLHGHRSGQGLDEVVVGLFPQWKPTIDQFRAKLNDLAIRVERIMRQDAEPLAQHSKRKARRDKDIRVFQREKSEQSTFLDEVADKLAALVRRTEPRLNPFDRATPAVIRDHILHVRHALLLLKACE